MEAQPLIDGATARILQALKRYGKSRLAAKADIRESVLRPAGRDGWNPTHEVIRKLEIAAVELDAENSAAGDAAPAQVAAQ